NRPDVLRIQLFGARREADQVDEDNADDTSFLAASRFLGERSPARETEARDLWVVLSAGPASRHLRILAALRFHSNAFGSSAVVGLTRNTPTTEGLALDARGPRSCEALFSRLRAASPC